MPVILITLEAEARGGWGQPHSQSETLSLILFIYLFIYLFLWYWGLNSGPNTLSHSTNLEIGSQGAICLGWLWTVTLLIISSGSGKKQCALTVLNPFSTTGVTKGMSTRICTAHPVGSWVSQGFFLLSRKKKTCNALESQTVLSRAQESPRNPPFAHKVGNLSKRTVPTPTFQNWPEWSVPQLVLWRDFHVTMKFIPGMSLGLFVLIPQHRRLNNAPNMSTADPWNSCVLHK
jgi:hypothetical protein